MAFVVEDWRAKKGSKIVESGLASKLVIRHSASHGGKIDLLDVGSGNGVFIDTLPSTYAVTAGDVDNYLSAETMKRVRGFVKVDLSDRWSVNDLSFDVVTAWNVLEHVENPSQFVREASRTLKQGGTLILSMPNIFSLKNRLYFLRTGDMLRFKHSNSHITILTKMVMTKIFVSSKLFTLVERGFSKPVELPWPFSYIPFISRIFPKTELFYHTIYYVFKKR